MTTTAARRGTSNHNDRGNTIDRRRRRRWLMETWESDVPGKVRCYRCGELLDENTLTIDRIEMGKNGGRYTRDNIRPACGPCNFGSNRTRGPWRDEEEPPEPDDEPWVSPIEKAWGSR